MENAVQTNSLVLMLTPSVSSAFVQVACSAVVDKLFFPFARMRLLMLFIIEIIYNNSVRIIANFGRTF